MLNCFRLLTALIFLFLFWGRSNGREEWENQVEKLAGDGAVCVTDLDGNILYSLRENKLLVPASILKIATAEAFIHEIGSTQFRFPTQFYLDSLRNLYVKGYGDPYFVSEEISLIAQEIAPLLEEKPLNGLFLDDTYFAPHIVIPGISHSLNPYDALNGALLVNFNTIFVSVSSVNKVSSAEEQTPLTDTAERLALAQGKKGTFRINLASDTELQLKYAGELLQAIFKQNGIRFQGGIQKRKVPEYLSVFYVHESSKDLEDVLQGLFKYSNNLIANQLLLYLGARKYGPPATLRKGTDALTEYLREKFQDETFSITEGSGISRQNQITALQMCTLLRSFFPYRELLPMNEGIYAKTGTLNNVNTLAGYFDSSNLGKTLCFAIILNNSLTNRENIVKVLADNL
ncbi:D-alanyl-D-alanine carboxypeptidase [bacterium]|nr:D-alanyl-D-alanine carboxypeptidase [bacterium]